jgi:hypothetical protein
LTLQTNTNNNVIHCGFMKKYSKEMASGPRKAAKIKILIGLKGI